jgi:hypothetical protein
MEEVEATEVLHDPNDAELNFRYLGTAKGRQFSLNIQFERADAMGERLRPEEFDFMISKVLRIVLEQVANSPNAALH